MRQYRVHNDSYLGSCRLFRQIAHVSVTTFQDHTATACHFLTFRKGLSCSKPGQPAARTSLPAAGTALAAALVDARVVRWRFSAGARSIARYHCCVWGAILRGHGCSLQAAFPELEAPYKVRNSGPDRIVDARNPGPDRILNSRIHCEGLDQIEFYLYYVLVHSEPSYSAQTPQSTPAFSRGRLSAQNPHTVLSRICMKLAIKTAH